MSNLQLGLRFRIERGLRLVMGAQVKALPEGWHEFVKHEKVWQWFCPWGELCGKHNQLLFENANKETVLDSAAMHLCGAVEHEEFTDFNIARGCAKDDGLNEITVKTTVYYDEDGVEHKDVPHATAKKMPQPPSKPPPQYERGHQNRPKHKDYYRNRDYYQNNADDQERHHHKKDYYQNNADDQERNHHKKDTEVIGARHSKGRQKTSSSRDQYDSKSNRESRARLRSASSKHRRSRSRGRGASNCHDVVSNSASRTSRAIVIDTQRSWPPIPLATGRFQIRAGPQDHEIIIGRVELDQIMDSLTRASNGANACAKWMKNFCKAAEVSFESEREILNSCRDALQRFTRA